MRLPVLFASSVLLVAGAASVQAQETREAGPSDRPVLELTSGHHNLVWRVAKALGGEDFTELEIPEPGEGQQLRVVMGADQKLRVAAVARGEHLLELRVRRQPEVLGRIASETLGPARRLLHMTTFMWLVTSLQMEARHAARAMEAALQFHRQVADLHLCVQRSGVSATGYAVDLWLEAKPDTWLQEVIRGIEANPRGGPHLRSPNATLTVTAAVRGKGLARFLEPFAAHLGRLRGKDREEREQFTRLARRRLEHFDGCFGLMIDGPGRYVRMIGLTRPEEYRKLAAQELARAFDCRRAGRADVVIARGDEVPPALADSGMRMLLKETDPFAFTEEEEKGKRKAARGLKTFAGVVEDFSIKARLPEEGREMARLLERVREERLQRMPLVEGALLRAKVHLGRGLRLGRHPNKEFQEAIKPLQAMLGELWKRVPETFDVALYKRDSRLHVQVRTR